VLCPSALCEEGSILIGIVQSDGHVGFISEKIIVDKDFIDTAKKGRSPEKRFRFSEECKESACKQWAHDRCGVIDKVISLMGPKQVPNELPQCSIRSHCRWYRQCGGRACAVCPDIITDSTADE
jgi:hypothetical protein